MIIKFDHITYVASLEKKRKVLSKFNDDNLLFKEINKKNMKEKYCLMNMQQEYFDMYYFDEVMPVEVLFYNEVFTGNVIFMEPDKRTVHARSTDLEICRNILKCIGFKEETICKQNNLKFNIKGIFDKSDYWICIEKASSVSTSHLDDQGYGCIAFLVDNLENLRNEIGNRQEIDVLTEPEDIIINGRCLKIFFVLFKVLNVIFEFIMPIRRTKNNI